MTEVVHLAHGVVAYGGRPVLRGVSLRVDAGVIMVTHDQAEAMALANKIAVMSEGRIALRDSRLVTRVPGLSWVLDRSVTLDLRDIMFVVARRRG